MENNSIDDLFRTGLSDLKRKPSSGAWSRIAQQGGNTRGLGAGWYAAAAGVVLALLTGYLLWQAGSKELARPPIAERSEIKTIPHTETAKVGTKAGNHDVPAGDVIRGESRRKVVQLAASKQHLSREIDSPLSIERKEVDSEIGHVSALQTISVAPALTEAESNQAYSASELSVKKQESAMPSRTIVINVSSTDSLEPPRMSRFARVFRQLKNARSGERVDWEEVGFNPRGMLARADSKRK
jgi:hypothetical protein